MRDDLIALFEFEQDGDDVKIVSEKHYHLVSPESDNGGPSKISTTIVRGLLMAWRIF